MSDLIRRQDAIDAILAVTGNSSVRELYEHVQEHGLSEMWSGGVNAAIDIIIAVPPVHPEPCEDTISRQAAIDAIKTWGLIDGLSEGQAIEILADEEKLPSAQPEHKKSADNGCTFLTCKHGGFGDDACSKCRWAYRDMYEANEEGERG